MLYELQLNQQVKKSISQFKHWLKSATGTWQFDCTCTILVGRRRSNSYWDNFLTVYNRYVTVLYMYVTLNNIE